MYFKHIQHYLNIVVLLPLTLLSLMGCSGLKSTNSKAIPVVPVNLIAQKTIIPKDSNITITLSETIKENGREEVVTEYKITTKEVQERYALILPFPPELPTKQRSLRVSCRVEKGNAIIMMSKTIEPIIIKNGILTPTTLILD